MVAVVGNAICVCVSVCVLLDVEFIQGVKSAVIVAWWCIHAHLLFFFSAGAAKMEKRDEW